MNCLTARELLGTSPSSSAGEVTGESLRDLERRPRPHAVTRGQKAFGGFVAVAIQAIFLAGLFYGTLRDIAPSLENITVVNILDETPMVEAAPPAPAPKFEQPVIHMQAPLVTIAQPEPAAAAPTAIISDRPTPPPPRVDEKERQRLIVEFQRALQRHLIREMRYPLAARAKKEEGVVYVRVAMNRRGFIQSAQIRDASDFPLLNEEAIAVVQRAQPLPLPPDVVAGDPVDLIIPVTFSLRMARGGHRRDN